MTESRVTRRRFIQGAGAAGIGVVVGAGDADADHQQDETDGDAADEYWAAQPSGVSIEYDEALLQEYQPRLRTYHLDEEPQTMYAWVARSPDRDTDALVYWCYYALQDGLGSADSHVQDREPVYVFRDSENGNIREIVYSGYHWLAARTPAPPTQDNHPKLRVAKNWHHYLLTDTPGADVDLANLHETFDSWLVNGWAEHLQPGACTNPWILRRRSSWWRDGPLGLNLTERSAELGLLLGIEGASASDLGRWRFF